MMVSRKKRITIYQTISSFYYFLNNSIRKGIISSEKIINSGNYNYYYDYARSFFGMIFNPRCYTSLSIILDAISLGALIWITTYQMFLWRLLLISAKISVKKNDLGEYPNFEYIVMNLIKRNILKYR